MKRYGLLGALIGFVIAVLGFTQIPAVAQQTEVESPWEITVMPYSGGTGANAVLVAKHNRVTGQTLLLSCSNACGGGEEWRDYPVEE